jgi:hypothetical protein
MRPSVLHFVAVCPNAVFACGLFDLLSVPFVFSSLRSDVSILFLGGSELQHLHSAIHQIWALKKAFDSDAEFLAHLSKPSER